MEWLQLLWRTVTSEEVLRVTLAVALGFVVRALERSRRDQYLTALIGDVVDFIEEHYQEWGIRGEAKMARFLEIFSEEYRRATGRSPSPQELNLARLRAEAQVQRARRAGRAVPRRQEQEARLGPVAPGGERGAERRKAWPPAVGLR
ncbi:MAG: hypothetical protein QJR13_02965 [Bacillota bacterium]|nr:hypothetical protein [Bacillota bacterium]